MSSTQPPDPVKTSPPLSRLPYVFCAMGMSLVGVIAVLTILLLRPDKDNTQLFATIASMLVPTTGVILALIKVGEVHVMMNSRLDQLLASEKQVSKAAGVEEGRLGIELKVAPTVTPAPPIVLPLQIQVQPPVLPGTEPVHVQIEQPATDPVPVTLPKEPGDG